MGSVLVSGYALEVARFSFVGEAVLIFWLLIEGVRLRRSEIPPNCVTTANQPAADQ